MRGAGRVVSLRRALGVWALCWAGCSSYPADRVVQSESVTQVDAGEGEDAAVDHTWAVDCRPAETSEALPARLITRHRNPATRVVTVSTQELFQRFAASCKGCHIDQGQGNLRILYLNDFLEKADQKFLDRIRSDDLSLVMPPDKIAFSQRPPAHPLRELAGLLEAWIKAGRAKEGFQSTQTRAADTPFIMDEGSADAMTNLGTCIPSPERIGSEQGRSVELDRKFAAMKSFDDLPDRLEQTDLFTLDSQELARYGVVAFAPAYTLWADNAKKVRMVRVPRGESIRFDPDTQAFDIPANTRFYKTFLKKVVDKDGQTRWRKMETRIIVSRPDADEAASQRPGAARIEALFGAYAWNEDETEAILVRDPLRNGKPFADRLQRYFTNEQEVERLILAGEPKLDKIAKDRGWSHTYAIPGSERCIDCHMGAPNGSFVLGFLPLQLHRRPKGEGGVIEPAGPDELNQLKRLIDYGVITGMSSPDQVTLLEDSQGTRKPRNEYELDAQGYMLGNCAHCHNPRGQPSSVAIELREDLNFMPSHDGGIFQFPLEKYSRRIVRGVDQNVAIPYITPSLYDRKSTYSQAAIDSEGRPLPQRAKLLQAAGDEPYLTLPAPSTPTGMAEVGPTRFKATSWNEPVLAPWRSLIYRNVDTPFSYEDDFTMFPHMPRNTPGYDCRARQLLGKWMVTIPAMLKPLPEGARPATAESEAAFLNDNSVAAGPSEAETSSTKGFWWSNFSELTFDHYEQPYREVVPGEAAYGESEIAAWARLEAFQKSPRYQCRPDSEDVLGDPETFDILDPSLESGLGATVPGPEPPYTTNACGQILRETCTVAGNVVPLRPHWFDTDLTEAGGDWTPRRGDWQSVIVEGRIPKPEEGGTEAQKHRNSSDRFTRYVLTGNDAWGLLPPRGASVKLTAQLRQWALTPVPMGFWQEKSECEARLATSSLAPPASSFVGVERPAWLSQKKNLPRIAAHPDSPVYMAPPGAQIFGTICVNCHGPDADSRGRMAGTIADMTGGDTRVANLRDGFFGPMSKPGSNRAAIFQAPPGSDGATSEDWAARYLAWMGLGGTQRKIPSAALNVIATTQVVGERRRSLTPLGNAGANMLALAELLCGEGYGVMRGTMKSDPVVPQLWFDPAQGNIASYEMWPWSGSADSDRPFPQPSEVGNSTKKPPPLALISSNGDVDLWERVCTFDNPGPVQVVTWSGEQLVQAFAQRTPRDELLKPTGGDTESAIVLLRRDAYAASGAGVGDHLGRVRATLDADNLHPWCVLKPSADAVRRQLEASFAKGRTDAAQPPYCPDGFLADQAGHQVYDLEWRLWRRRGAMNAGLAVFTYLDALSRGETRRPVPFDRCQDLPNP